MVNFIVTGILILPWVCFPFQGIVDQFREPKLIFLDFMFMGIITFGIINGTKVLYKNKYLGWFLGWVLLHTLVKFFIPLGIVKQTGQQVPIWMIEPLVHFLLGIFALYIMLSILTKDDYKKIAKFLCISAVMVSIWAILQYIGLDPWGLIAKYTCGNIISSALDNPNLVGNYLVLCLPLFLLFNTKKSIVGIILTVVAIFITKSHIAYALFALEILVYFFIKYKINRNALLIMLAITTILFGVFLSSDFMKVNTNLGGRLYAWQISYEKLKDNPLFGQGLGVYKTLGVITGAKGIYQGGKDSKTLWTQAHNDWLERTIEFGLIGLSLLILVVVNSIRNFKDNYAYFASFIAFIAMMFFSFPMEIAPLMFIGLLTFGAIETKE